MADALPQAGQPKSKPDLPSGSVFARARRHRTALAVVFSTVAFVIVAIAISNITRDVDYGTVQDALARTPWQRVLLAAGFTAISFACLIFYDVKALWFIGRPLPLPQVALVSFSAYAVGNTAGFGPLSGGAIRYRGYSRLGLKGEEVARVVAYVTLAFGIGLAVMTGLAVLVFAWQVGGLIGVNADLLRIVAAGLLVATVAGLVWLWRGRPVTADEAAGAMATRLPPVGTCLTQLLVTAIDIAAAASVLYVLLPGDVPLHWPAFVALFCVALGLGVLSHVPAGLGVFEAVIIGGLGPAVPTEQIIGALVLYRLIYHVGPLFLAVIALAIGEALEYRRSVAALWTQAVNAAVVPPLMAMLALICGVMLVFSSVLPTPQANLDWLSNWVPIQILEAAHFLSSLLGLLLVIIARGLVHRMDGARIAGIVTGLTAIAFTVPKALAPWEAAALAVLVAGLALNRRCFDRRARLLAEPLTPVWLGAIAVMLVAALTILFFVYRDVGYSRELWWQFEFSEEAPRGLRAMMGLSIGAVAIAVASLLRPARARPRPATPGEIARATAIVAAQDDSGGNLVRMGDKAVLFSEDGRAFVMYAVQGRSWISLFGPIGAEDARPELVWRFIEAARAGGGRAVFYEAPPDLLGACADAGLRALKLGEMARVDLVALDFSQSRWGEQRRALAKGERDGMSLEILPPEAVPAVLDRLEQISDAWLGQHEAREKGFALGRFERTFVCTQPVAVLRLGAEIVAFATLMLTETKAEATVDLMRFGPGAPKGAMDYLFGALLREAKAQGFRTFNLGMAPLSGFATHAAAPMWNHFGQAIFTHGERFYNFRGLRAFKAKYNPDWQPRYLIVGGGVSPVAALVDVTLLIGGGFRGVVGK
ncbi:bifunctional lysylphosphatidylglycerol flippase/synthetase MprF [Paenirhodobacter sp.]|uniref:bifunctional lysylphosphatidylglycerol flippase/synthetase MprF n=1 Tax=Paenirhodobacter sp. TaxID=1965326 RepID=UPI003B3CC231